MVVYDPLLEESNLAIKEFRITSHEKRCYEGGLRISNPACKSVQGDRNKLISYFLNEMDIKEYNT